ncbi:MAG: dual specificity protein phosphatase family protein [Candidatus Acidiferrales bacterium]|jgi:tyrosine-protein phosphatase SIW14
MATKPRIRILSLASSALLVAIVLVAADLYHAEHYPAHGAALAPAGVPNFGEVTPLLYRGGQPSQEGFQALKKQGVEIVVNFRDERDLIQAERHQVEPLGIRYVSIPWSSWHRPRDQQVSEFLALLRAHPQKKIFVHCHHGADRTGVMVAAYRIAAQNWTPQQAIAEMELFHFHSFWLFYLKSYVEDFPRLLAADPSLRAVHPAALTSAP